MWGDRKLKYYIFKRITISLIITNIRYLYSLRYIENCCLSNESFSIILKKLEIIRRNILHDGTFVRWCFFDFYSKFVMTQENNNLTHMYNVGFRKFSRIQASIYMKQYKYYNITVKHPHSDYARQPAEELSSNLTFVLHQTRHGRPERRVAFLPVHFLYLVGVVNEQQVRPADEVAQLRYFPVLFVQNVGNVRQVRYLIRAFKNTRLRLVYNYCEMYTCRM